MFESLRILIARNRPGLEIFKQSTVDTYLLATKSTPVYNITKLPWQPFRTSPFQDGEEVLNVMNEDVGA